MGNSKEDLRYFILNYEQPVVFKGMIQWNLLSWNLTRWNDLIGAEIIKYRIGKQSFTKNPQWENTSDYRESTFSEFLQYIERNPGLFVYCEYKHLVENFKNVKELQNGISWESFGFPDYTAEKSTIWIGSKGAHTPCHKDTYGCNLVAQAYGSKRWLLFPPEENLFPTRVPYEESSIFSKLNFYSPNLKICKDLGKCRTVILNPGDVLLVPHNWWHYVENLETAISINVWLEREDDVAKQLDESLIQFLIGSIFSNMTEAQKKSTMNPSTDLALFTEQVCLTSSLKILDKCRDNYNVKRKRSKHNNIHNTKSFNCEEILQKYKDFIKTISTLTRTEFEELLHIQYKRFPLLSEPEEESDESILCKLINAFTSENVINLVKTNFISSYNHNK